MTGPSLVGALDPDVRSAIAEVRSRGIAVVLVTGRILEELRQIMGGLDLLMQSWQKTARF